MSYSIGVRAATKALALAALAVSFDENVIRNQPVHAADKAPALAAAGAFVNMLADDDGQDVVISINGSLTWRDVGGDVGRVFSGASVSVSAYLTTKEQPKA